MKDDQWNSKETNWRQIQTKSPFQNKNPIRNGIEDGANVTVCACLN